MQLIPIVLLFAVMYLLVIRPQQRRVREHASFVQSLRYGEEVVTEPLSSEERRIIHRTLNDDERVVTESYGDGVMKRVAIRPA